MTMLIPLEKIQSWSLFVERESHRFPELCDPSHWQNAYTSGELVAKITQTIQKCEGLAPLNQQLRQFRRAEMVRIAIRDLNGMAEVTETLRDLSDLADALVASTVDWHYQQMVLKSGTPIGEESGEPQRMLVLGMGKLGGHELNFSSDIDLIFVYPEKGQTQGAKKTMANDQFFIRLGQAVNKSLTEMTADGMVYRVDMRLRPFGKSGPLAVSFSEMENYYQLHGRAWERYALVKARVIAGDVKQGQELSKILRPFVYRKYVDFSAIESLRELKMMINAEVKKKDKHRNIKLGPGGIREIEFIVQAFQLVHGGRDTLLQGRQLIPMLQTLLDRQYIDPVPYQGLMAAYVFLRRAENHLQEWNDQQTHDLPIESTQKIALAQSMGFEDYDDFFEILSGHLQFVQTEFDAVFAEEVSDHVEEDASLKEACLSDQIDEEVLEHFQLRSPQQLAEILTQFLNSRAYTHASSNAVNRFKAVLPGVLKGLQQIDDPVIALERALTVIGSVMNRSVYLVLLKENAQAIPHLLQLCSLSAWMSETLVKYPALLDQLLDERILYEPLALAELKQEALSLLVENALDEEGFMNQLRQWKHAQVFRVAAADITGHVPIMKVSDYLTWIAEAVLLATTQFAWQFMQHRNGLPGGVSSAEDLPFLIIGYGKLGGIELGYGSDLDIVFLYDGLKPSAKSQGDKPLENNVYFIRMTQKIISLVTTFMPSGRLYEVDTRLRPNGASGMIVTDMAAFQAYQQNKAWVWEHQALVRTRAIVGSEKVKANFEAFKQRIISSERPLASLRSEVVAMRQKMQASLNKSTHQSFDLKQGLGGIVDIEFMVQYLVLGYAHQFKSLTSWSDNIRLLEEIKALDILPEAQVDALVEVYRQYRAIYHRLALQNEKSLIDNDWFVSERALVVDVWNSVMLAD